MIVVFFTFIMGLTFGIEHFSFEKGWSIVVSFGLIRIHISSHKDKQ